LALAFFTVVFYGFALKDKSNRENLGKNTGAKFGSP
jgi:hypothetical protein